MNRQFLRPESVVIACTAMLFPAVALSQQDSWPVPAKAQRIVLAFKTSVDAYDQVFAPFQIYGLSGGTRGGRGAYLGHLNVGQRDGVTGVQIEGETYPVIGPKLYGYLDYAYGTRAVFPRHRFGAEAFTVLAPALEGSGGFRFFHFHDRRSVVLLTGSAAIYSGNLWFSIRPYATVNLAQNAASVTVSGRWYFGGDEEFLFVRAGFGYTPDERPVPSTGGVSGVQVFTLTSQTAGTGGQMIVSDKLLILCHLDFTRQEVGFRPGTFVLLTSILVSTRYTL